VKRVLTLLAGIVVCIAGTGGSPLHAGWTIDGAPVFTRGGVESMPRICSDGAGGAIIVCIESSFYPPRIYAQRINELGRARWAVNGVQISFSENSTNRPRIAADGSGGAIIVWEDYYDSVTFDLYAQRVDSLGNLLWNPDGVPVSTAHDDQYWSEICTDGAGGCIIAWQDERTSTNSDIYAQRINASGNPVWTAGGIAICTADSIQWDVQIVPDGSGGAVMVWVDYRDIGDLYAQRVNAAGAAQWTANGAPVCLNTVINYEPKIASDGAGGAFVTWYDRRVTSFDAYLQRIDSSGNEVFTPGGIVLCNEASAIRRSPPTAPAGRSSSGRISETDRR
jgi:hypothetical protein